MRVILTKEPYTDLTREWYDRGYWPAKWIGHPEVRGLEPAVTAYRRRFVLSEKTKIRIHVTADERYELFLDGRRIGRGPERGDKENWFYETHDLDLDAGEHVLVARTWSLSGQGTSQNAQMHEQGLAPHAQMTVRPGFLLSAENVAEDLLNTGTAAWDCKKLGGYYWVPQAMCWGTGAKVHIRGDEFDWGFETGAGEGWVEAEPIARVQNATVANEYPEIWMLTPATLPPMLEEPLTVGTARHVQAIESDETREVAVKAADHLPDEAEAWNRLLAGERALTIPANTTRRVIVDLGNYYCAFPEMVTSGGKGSSVRIWWAEALYMGPKTGEKGNRDEIEGKHFVGIGDTFEPDGGQNRRFESLWWEAGRYLEFLVRTGEAPLTIESFRIRETHYPYSFDASFDSSEPRLSEVTPIAFRGLEMCSHETYMDCPYYEQLMYVGDTRLEVLTTYAITGDSRLPRKAIRMFDESRRNSGITQSRYPNRITQVIPPFSLWWIGMVYDYAIWRDDPAFVADRMPGVRAVLDAYRRWMNADGLVESPIGWNYMDWVQDWYGGIPPDGHLGVSSVLNLQMAMVLRLAAELEDFAEEPELAARNRRHADALSVRIESAFWDDRRGMLADDLEKTRFSEHAHCLAILGDSISDARRERLIEGLLTQPDLARTTIYFTHYLFETFRKIGRMDRFFERMPLWYDLRGQGFKTPLETPEPSRSDCHAWGAHPIYHYFASVLGIRPAAPGFRKVEIRPQMGPLTWAKGTLPHPKGFVTVDFRLTDGKLSGTVELPEGITGTLVRDGRPEPLHPGRQEV